MTAAPTPPPRALAGLAVLTLPTALLGLDVTVMYLAVPALSADLRPSGTEELWIMDAYGFLVAGFLVTMGTLGDRIGRRRLLMIGSVAFAMASVAAAFSTSAAMLIVSRAALGVAGATLMPSTLSLISTLFPDPRRRAVAFGVWATAFSAGMAAGPVVGGLLLAHFWWGSAFLLAVPVGVLVLLGAATVLPPDEHTDEHDPSAPRGRIDLSSVGLSLLAVLPVVWAVKHAAASGPDLAALVALVVGLSAGAAFVHRQRHLDDPLLDLRLFTIPAFSAALVVLLVGLIGVGGSLYLVTRHLQLVEGMSPLRAGGWMGPPALMMLVAAVGAPLLARRIRPGRIVAGTLALSAVGYALLAGVDGPGHLGDVVIGFGLVYLGLGAIAALGTDLVVGGAPADRAGSASALSETVQELGIALGVAVLGSVATAVYRAEVSGLPGFSPAARESLGIALSSADPDVAVAARAAASAGMSVASTVAAVATAVLAVVAAVVLRRVETIAPPDADGSVGDLSSVTTPDGGDDGGSGEHHGRDAGTGRRAPCPR